MKRLCTLILLFTTALVIISCKKDCSTSIVGRWSIVKDFSFVAEAPPFFNAGQGGTYVGVEGDYYDFRTDGSLFIKEGPYSDTLTYKVLPGNEVNFIFNTYNTTTDSLGNIISQEHPKKIYSIVTVSSTNLTLSSNLTPDILTPEGYLANKLELKK